MLSQFVSTLEQLTVGISLSSKEAIYLLNPGTHRARRGVVDAGLRGQGDSDRRKLRAGRA